MSTQITIDTNTHKETNMRTFFALPLAALTACGADNAQTSDSTEALAPSRIELQPGHYSGYSEVITDTCDLGFQGQRDAVTSLWVGNGLSGFDCSPVGNGTWSCEDYTTIEGDCGLLGSEHIALTPVTETSFRLTDRIEYSSASCKIDCYIVSVAELVRY